MRPAFPSTKSSRTKLGKLELEIIELPTASVSTFKAMLPAGARANRIGLELTEKLSRVQCLRGDIDVRRNVVAIIPSLIGSDGAMVEAHVGCWSCRSQYPLESQCSPHCPAGKLSKEVAWHWRLVEILLVVSEPTCKVILPAGASPNDESARISEKLSRVSVCAVISMFAAVLAAFP